MLSTTRSQRVSRQCGVTASGARAHVGQCRRPASVPKALGVDVPSLVAANVSTEQLVTYGALAAPLLSFVVTFGIVPRFKQHFREAESWQEIYTDLMALGGVQPVTPRAVMNRARRGAVVIDVRMQRAYVQGTAPGAVNHPLYQPIAGWTLPANMRRAGFAFFGMYGTERNPAWLRDLQLEVPKDAEIIVACGMGGSLDCKAGAECGFASQSLKAAYFLKKAGYRNVCYMKGGLAEYKREVGDLADAPAQAAPAPKDARGGATLQS